MLAKHIIIAIGIILSNMCLTFGWVERHLLCILPLTKFVKVILQHLIRARFLCNEHSHQQAGIKLRKVTCVGRLCTNRTIAVLTPCFIEFWMQQTIPLTYALLILHIVSGSLKANKPI